MTDEKKPRFSDVHRTGTYDFDPRGRFKPTKSMSDFDATMIAEGQWELTTYEQNEENLRDAWQHLVDTGLAWKLQGWFGRQAQALIESGVIKPYPRGIVE